MAQMLTYRIPSVVRLVERNGQTIRRLESIFPNPSDRLRPIGFRPGDDGSVWIIPEGREPYNLVAEMTEAGCEVNMVKFDHGEADKLAAMARHGLLKAIENHLKRQGQTAVRELKKFERSESEDRQETLVKNMAWVVKKTEKLLKCWAAAAQGFGLDPSFILDSSCRDVVAKLKTATEARAFAYAKMTNQVNGTDLGEAAARDLVPAGILADYCEERGEDVTEARILFS
jgi:hypothetical protein